jgi:hypothetical protein
MDKLEGIKEGNAIEVTFRGVVYENPTFKTLYVLVEKGGLSSPTIFTEEEINAPSFSIKKVEPPIAVGDRVKGSGIVSSKRVGGVIAVCDDLAWVRWESSSMTPAEHAFVPVGALERL